MTAKEELKQYKYAIHKVDEAMNEYEKYKLRAEKMTSIITGMPTGHGGSSDKVGDNAAVMADIEKQYEERWIIAEKKKLEIEKKIEQIAEPYRTLLHMRYIQGMDFETIAIKMGYSYVRITHLHGDALMEYEKLTTHDKT